MRSCWLSVRSDWTINDTPWFYTQNNASNWWPCSCRKAATVQQKSWAYRKLARLKNCWPSCYRPEGTSTSFRMLGHSMKCQLIKRALLSVHACSWQHKAARPWLLSALWVVTFTQELWGKVPTARSQQIVDLVDCSAELTFVTNPKT